MIITAVDTMTAIRDNKPVEQTSLERQVKEEIRQPPQKEENKGVHIDDLV
jgi:hypothetical protein